MKYRRNRKQKFSGALHIAGRLKIVNKLLTKSQLLDYILFCTLMRGVHAMIQSLFEVLEDAQIRRQSFRPIYGIFEEHFHMFSAFAFL